jgi:hypothetical protein
MKCFNHTAFLSCAYEPIAPGAFCVPVDTMHLKRYYAGSFTQLPCSW